MGTKSNPSEYDCYAKLEPDEPYFVLMGRDPVAWLVVGMWCVFRATYADEPERIKEARRCARAMKQWAIDKGKQALIDKVLETLDTLSPGFEVLETFIEAE